MSDTLIKHGNHYLLGNGNGYAYSHRRSMGYTLNSHLHDCYEFVYISEGSCLYIVDGKEFMLSTGDIIFTCPNSLHSFSFPKECMFDRQFLHVYPNLIKAFPDIAAKLFLAGSEHKNHIPSYLVEQYKLDKYFSELHKYSDNAMNETFMIAYSCAMGLISKISIILSNVDMRNTASINNKNISKILQYIDCHFLEPISLNDIAESIYMSTVYICKLFKRETGMTLKSYINMYRIVKAKNLILDGEKISSLHNKCGFENYSTFYRSFIKYVGMSPEQFKNFGSA